MDVDSGRAWECQKCQLNIQMINCRQWGLRRKRSQPKKKSNAGEHYSPQDRTLSQPSRLLVATLHVDDYAKFITVL